MKLFISGATGYIGHLLAMEAACKGYTVHALVRDPSSPFFSQSSKHHPFPWGYS